jgi:hypothetical protein
MPARWTETQIAFARDNWKTMPRPEIAARLGKSLDAVTHYAYRYGWSQREPAQTYEHLTSEELAYIAGIIDGEGHIEIGLGKIGVTKQTRHAVSIVVANTHFGLLDWLRRRLPGSYIRPRVLVKAKPHWKPQWYLRLHRRGSVQSLLTQVLPHLIVKRERALEALAAIDGIRNRQWR